MKGEKDNSPHMCDKNAIDLQQVHLTFQNSPSPKKVKVLRDYLSPNFENPRYLPGHSLKDQES